MKSSMPYRGLTSPELRALLRPLLADPALAPASREAWEADVRALWDDADLPRGALRRAGAHRAPGGPAVAGPGRRSGLYRYLVETGAWWDYVDLVAADRVGPILLRHREVVTPMMRADAVDDHLWVRRTAILAQLKHREETDLDLLADVIDANLEGSRVRAGVLHPQGHRLGAAPARPHRPASGCGPSSRPRGDRLSRPVPTRGPQAPLTRHPATTPGPQIAKSGALR